MPATRPSKEFRALCYEHHLEMSVDVSLLNSEQKDKQKLAYACRKPDCAVHYSILRGYFIPGQNGNRNEMDILPSLRCVRDGTPLYLAEIDQEKRALRLWLCPQCGAQRSNEDDLVGATAEGVHDGKRGSPPQTSGSTPI